MASHRQLATLIEHETGQPVERRRDRVSHGTAREGTIAGAIGATAVALWFLIVDLVAAHAFYTPDRLGAALAASLGLGEVGLPLHVVGYTIFHYAAFAAVGVIATAIVHRARSEPNVLAAAFLVFIVIELGFYGFIALLHATELLGSLTWPLIAIGNLIGAVAIGVTLWRRHPGIGRAMDDALGGRT